MIVVASSAREWVAGLSVVLFHGVPLGLAFEARLRFCGGSHQQLATTSLTYASVSSVIVKNVFPFGSGDSCRELEPVAKPTGVSEGERAGLRTSAALGSMILEVLYGVVWGRAIACSENLVGFRGPVLPVGALCVSMCVTLQHATCRRVDGDVVQILCMHLVVVSEREISTFVMCVGVFCITMTKSGAGPNGCVSKFQVDVKRVIHICVVNSRFTHDVAVFA